MRQGQQNRRGRNRGRKQQNPLARNYESNGPDVRIRGTASHIADKYGSLARDALSAGDTVAAENLFQHAEHYNRIIMAAQAQLNPQSPQPTKADASNGTGPQPPLSNGPDDSENALASGEEEQVESGKKSASTDSESNRRRGRRKSTGNGNTRSKARADSKNKRADQVENGKDSETSAQTAANAGVDGDGADKVEQESGTENSNSDPDDSDLTPDVPVV